jgi:ketosteroid isomerase-like protein
MNDIALQALAQTAGLDAKRVDDLIALFETLTPSNLLRLDDFYSPTAAFKDPFNDISGREAIGALFAHMFETLQAPHFVVHDRMVQGGQLFLTWSFFFHIKGFKGGQVQTIEGSSYLRWSLTPQGVWMIDAHRDYWDAAQELYEKFPIVGGVLRWLRKRLASPTLLRAGARDL